MSAEHAQPVVSAIAQVADPPILALWFIDQAEEAPRDDFRAAR